MNNNLVPYINEQIDNKFKYEFGSNVKLKNTDVSLIYINPDTSVRTAVLEIPEASASQSSVFNTEVVPTFDGDSSIWKCELDPTQSDYGKLFYKGNEKIEVEIDLSYVGDANTDTNNLEVKLQVRGNNIENTTFAGRGYDQNTKVIIYDQGRGGRGGIITANVNPNNPAGGVGGYTIVNGGENYVAPTLEVVGKGVNAKVTVSVVNGSITNYSRVSTAPSISALPIFFKPAQDKPFGGSQKYVFTMVPGDDLLPKIQSTKAGSSTISDCLVYQILLKVSILKIFKE